jgi:Lrp/AsnC family leucine-responsive transcriptional regulator
MAVIGFILKGIEMDHIDRQIIALLKLDSKQSYKRIGEKIHMTGQAVGNRIQKMESEGLIEQYTIGVNTEKLGLIRAYIMIFMKHNGHQHVQQFMNTHDAIVECTRISGEGCYMLTAETHDVLNALCDELLTFANYKLNIVTATIKRQPL